MKVHVAVVGIIAFVVFSVVTLFVSPTFPPGSALYSIITDFFGNPEITYSLFGFTGEALVNGLLNGVSWGLLIAIIYYFGNRSSRGEVIVVPVAKSTPRRIPMPILMRTIHSQPTMRTIHSQPTMRTIHSQPTINLTRQVKPMKKYVSTFVSLDKNVQIINGIGPEYSNRFRFNGVEDLSDLLREGSTEIGRRHLAANVGVSLTKINRWVNQADFFRIKGIGKQYADLLDAVGVNTVVDLSNRNPMDLYAKIKEINWNKNLVERVPPFSLVQNWVESAKKLEPRLS